MAWRNVCFLTDASHAGPLCDALLEAGALSACIEDADAGTPDEQPQFGEPGSVNTPGWTHSRVVVLLEPDADIDAVLGEDGHYSLTLTQDGAAMLPFTGLPAGVAIESRL